MSLSPLAALAIGAYCAIFAGLAVFGAHRYWLIARYFRHQEARSLEEPFPEDPPTVLIQLPLYNELYVAERLIRAVSEIDYPRDRLEIQVLDDSTDDTTAQVERVVLELKGRGHRIEHLRRGNRVGYKAGALAWGLERSSAELVALFDADFVPQADFLRRTVGHFSDPQVGMVQTRWEHLNSGYNLLTRIQAVMLDGHFVLEHGGRSRSGCLFNFNGTAGIWRRAAIEEAGGWQHDTLTEDLDLSYRAQLVGWKFIYRPDVATPAEVPVNVLAFKTQQRRWTRGSIQTARKLLGPIWRSDTCLSCKVESTLHLLNNLTYVLLLGLALLLFPVYAARNFYGIQWVFWVDVPMLLAGTGALAAFYANAQRELGRSPWRGIAYLPAVMAVGMGMSVNNTWAVLEGLFGGAGEFVRTPKYRIESRVDRWRRKIYPGRRQILVPAAELAVLGYLVATSVYCAANALWWPFPFLVLFVSGYGYVSLTTLAHSGLLHWVRPARKVDAEGGQT